MWAKKGGGQVNFNPYRLGKLAGPCVNDDQKLHVDYQNLNSGRPHDYWIWERLIYEILCFLFFLTGYTVLQKKYT